MRSASPAGSPLRSRMARAPTTAPTIWPYPSATGSLRTSSRRTEQSEPVTTDAVSITDRTAKPSFRVIIPAETPPSAGDAEGHRQTRRTAAQPARRSRTRAVGRRRRSPPRRRGSPASRRRRACSGSRCPPGRPPPLPRQTDPSSCRGPRRRPGTRGQRPTVAAPSSRAATIVTDHVARRVRASAAKVQAAPFRAWLLLPTASVCSFSECSIMGSPGQAAPGRGRDLSIRSPPPTRRAAAAAPYRPFSHGVPRAG